MLPYKKDPVDKDLVTKLNKVFGVDPLVASILVRRGLKDPRDLLFHKECDARYMHSPFLFDSMEDAVTRINDALENNEEIFIFGDSDVDGMMATVILYRYLKNIGAKVTYRIPQKNEPYGITIDAIDEFILSTGGAGDVGRLIITVDNGISAFKAVQYAAALGIDTIITDHHNPAATLPQATVIIDPKITDSGYPFKDICGAQVVYKLVSALRFSKTTLYENDITFLDIHIDKMNEESNTFIIECIKTRNLIEHKRAIFKVSKESERLDVLNKISDFLVGTEIFVWNKVHNEQLLTECFGRAVEFSLFDAKSQIIKAFPKLRDMGLIDLIPLSRLARYAGNTTLVDSLFNIFITYTNHALYKEETRKNCDSDLQLAALATAADVMPLVNENRIFVKKLMSALELKTSDSAIMEIAAVNNVLMPGKKISARDISFGIAPILNAAGKMGNSDLVMQLFMETDNIKKQQLSLKILDIYKERKKLVDNGIIYITNDAQKSFDKYKKASVVFCAELNSSVVGLIASRFAEKFNAPAIVMTLSEDKKNIIGSIRTKRGVCATDLLSFIDKNASGDGVDTKKKSHKKDDTARDELDTEQSFFNNYGGHNKAAGFTFKKEKLDSFWLIFEKALDAITLNDAQEVPNIDAQLPAEYINDKILNIIDEFAPYGEGNKPLLFFTQNIRLHSAAVIGKSDKKHLKVTLDTGKCLINALFWDRDDLINNISGAHSVNILYNVERNYFNGFNSPQLILSGIERCDS